MSATEETPADEIRRDKLIGVNIPWSRICGEPSQSGSVANQYRRSSNPCGDGSQHIRFLVSSEASKTDGELDRVIELARSLHSEPCRAHEAKRSSENYRCIKWRLFVSVSGLIRDAPNFFTSPHSSSQHPSSRQGVNLEAGSSSCQAPSQSTIQLDSGAILKRQSTDQHPILQQSACIDENPKCPFPLNASFSTLPAKVPICPLPLQAPLRIPGASESGQELRCDNFQRYQRKLWSEPRSHTSSYKSPSRPQRNSPIILRELAIVRTVGRYGMFSGQFNMPQGICLGTDDDIVVTDTLNQRVQIFDKWGRFKFSWGTPGTKPGQIWHPRKVAFLPRSNRVLVSDRVGGASRIQVFEYNGIYVGTLKYLHGLRVALNTTTAGIAVYCDQIIVVEVQPAACIILNDNGTVAGWFSIENLVVEPSDVVAVQHRIFISDFRRHCECVFDFEGRMTGRIGGMYDGLIQYPRGLGLTTQGHLLVTDTDTNRFHVSVWNMTTGAVEGHYCLPSHKVSHSCGIVMNEVGLLVTVAKKDHLILVMQFSRRVVAK